MLESIKNIWTNYIDSLKDAASEAAKQKMNELMSSLLVSLGENIQEVAIILIVIGALLLICRYTKVLRWGFISYLLGLLIELIGIAMIK